MQDGPLLVSGILRHGLATYSDSVVITRRPDGYHHATFAEVGERAGRLASALAELGVADGDRVGTFMWNNQEHLEAYLAVPAMGAVLHTLNIRLFPEQLAFVINDAADKVIVVDASVAPLLARVFDQLRTVEHVVVVGGGGQPVDGLGATVAYEDLLAAQDSGFTWPDLDERQAAAMCYTSGTTGDPKGVVYSHRSTWLHSFGGMTANVTGIGQYDRILAVVPMFHANAWGVPYTAFMAGADLVMPERFLQAEPLADMFATQRPTLSLGVPTIWNDLLRWGEEHPLDLSSVRMLMAGGAAVPRSMIVAFQERYGVPLMQGWGMTETSPVCAFSGPPRSASDEEQIDWRARTGRVVAGVEIRVVDDSGAVLPADGTSVGEFEVRGPWITGSYFGGTGADRFHDGWLRTGDVGSLDEYNVMMISDRTKDVIKSGGEWISSVELENQVMAHPSVFEAAVIGVPDPKWDERPLVAVVAAPGSTPDPDGLVRFLQDRVARWWLPERWALVDEIPKTSVGKFDKKRLRAQVAAGEVPVVEVSVPGRASSD
jgi:fatty-acyl-CoA synthase